MPNRAVGSPSLARDDLARPRVLLSWLGSISRRAPCFFWSVLFCLGLWSRGGLALWFRAWGQWWSALFGFVSIAAGFPLLASFAAIGLYGRIRPAGWNAERRPLVSWPPVLARACVGSAGEMRQLALMGRGSCLLVFGFLGLFLGAGWHFCNLHGPKRHWFFGSLSLFGQRPKGYCPCC